MNPSNSESLIYEIEKEINVENIIFQNINLWPLLRIMIASELLIRTNNRGVVRKFDKSRFRLKRFLNFSKWLFNVLNFLIRDFRGNSLIKKAEAVFYVNNSNKILCNELWLDRLCDPIVEHLKQKKISSFILEDMSSLVGKYPRRFKSKIIALKMKFSILDSRINPTISLPNMMKNEEIIKIITFLEDKGIYLRCLHKKQLLNSINTFFSFKKIFYKYLKTIEPKYGFLICFYSSQGMAFCAACKELGIISVDIQHGLAGAHQHRAYSNWSKVPHEGYALLPSIFWTWSQTDLMEIRKWSIKCPDRHNAIVGGMVWNKYLHESLSLNFTNIKEEFKIILEKHSHSLQVLVSLQTGVVFPEWFVDVLNDRELNIFWWIRKHPNYDETQKNLLNQIVNENVEVQLASSIPLPIILSSIDIHVTCHSAVVLEAQLMGKPSIVLTELGYSLFCQNSMETSVLCAKHRDDLVSLLHGANTVNNSLTNHNRVHSESLESIIGNLLQINIQ